VKVVSRGVYAAVPPGIDPKSFQPDRYLVASAVRSDAIFSHHAALELLGAAHSDWNVSSVFTSRRRPSLAMNGASVLFLQDPPRLRSTALRTMGTREVERVGITLLVTGPERTLLDGLRQPRFAGGLAELVESAAGFGVLDLDLLLSLLRVYDQRTLWAGAGWFLEGHRNRFFVTEEYLRELEKNRPRSRQYVPRGRRRGGVLVSRWNLVLPENVVKGADPDERQ
jgi:predicted transcriptional regulator of viral defense system